MYKRELSEENRPHAHKKTAAIIKNEMIKYRKLMLLLKARFPAMVPIAIEE
jgi:hypothetical protein